MLWETGWALTEHTEEMPERIQTVVRAASLTVDILKERATLKATKENQDMAPESRLGASDSNSSA